MTFNNWIWKLFNDYTITNDLDSTETTVLSVTFTISGNYQLHANQKDRSTDKEIKIY